MSGLRSFAVVAALAVSIAVAPARAEIDPAPPKAWLGIGFEELPDAARVTEVHPGTAAAAAGLRPDDVIIAVGGQPLGLGLGLPQIVSTRVIGQRLPIVFLRDGRQFRVTPRLTARPSSEEIVYQRLIDRALPGVAPVDRQGVAVPAGEWARQPQVWTVFDVRCDRCATAAAALGARLTEAADDGAPRAPLRVVLVGQVEETAAFLARVPVLGTVWRLDRDELDRGSPMTMRPAPLGRRFLAGLDDVTADGVVLVIDGRGVVRFATALSAGETAHDGVCAAAAAVTRAWRH